MFHVHELGPIPLAPLPEGAPSLGVLTGQSEHAAVPSYLTAI